MSDPMNGFNKGPVINIDYRKKLKHAKLIAAPIVLIVIIFFVFVNSFYTLDSSESAVVLRFGKVATVVTEDGPHFKAPFIDVIRKVNVNNIYSMEYGYRTVSSGSENTQPVYTPVPEESKVIVDAASIVLIEIVVQYKVTDPVAFLFNVSDVQGTLRLALEDSVRSSVQGLTLDEAKTQKELIDAAIKPALQKKMTEYGSGLQIVLVGTQNVRFLDSVEAAYQEKENANQYKIGKIEDAERYKNTILPQANAEATQLIEGANAYKAERLANAKAAVAQFDALYSEYVNNKEILKEKYYLEAMTQFVLNNNIVIDTTKDGDIYKFYNFNESDLVKEQVSSEPIN